MAEGRDIMRENVVKNPRICEYETKLYPAKSSRQLYYYSQVNKLGEHVLLRTLALPVFFTYGQSYWEVHCGKPFSVFGGLPIRICHDEIFTIMVSPFSVSVMFTDASNQRN